MARSIPLVYLAICVLYVSSICTAFPQGFSGKWVNNKAKSVARPTAVFHKGKVHVHYTDGDGRQELWGCSWDPKTPGDNSWGDNVHVTGKNDKPCGQVVGSPASTSDGHNIYVVMQLQIANALAMMSGQDGIAPVEHCPDEIASGQSWLQTWASPALIYVPFTEVLLLVTLDDKLYMTWSTRPISGDNRAWSAQQRVQTSSGYIGVTGTTSLVYDKDSNLVYAFHNGAGEPNPKTVWQTTYSPLTNTWSPDVQLSAAGGSFKSDIADWIPRVGPFFDSEGNGQNIYLMSTPNDQFTTFWNTKANGLSWQLMSNSGDKPGTACSEFVTWTYSGVTYTACFYRGSSDAGLWYTGFQSLPPCQPGSYLTSGKCQPCPAGTFKDKLGFSSCLPCPVGYYSAVTGTVICSACQSNTFGSSVGSTSCAACPATAPFSLVAATKQSDCCSTQTQASLGVDGSLKLLLATATLYTTAVRMDIVVPDKEVLEAVKVFSATVGPIMAGYTVGQRIQYLASVDPNCPHH